MSYAVGDKVVMTPQAVQEMEGDPSVLGEATGPGEVLTVIENMLVDGKAYRVRFPGMRMDGGDGERYRDVTAIIFFEEDLLPA